MATVDDHFLDRYIYIHISLSFFLSGESGRKRDES